MNKQILTTQLGDFGLTQIESIIYIYLLENGSKTPLELSRRLNIDRSKIYRHLDKLITKRLIEESHTSWGKKYQATSPNNLSSYVSDQEEELNDKKQALPSLINQLDQLPNYTKREFEIKHYRGQEGLKQMLWNHLSAKKEILAFSYKNKNDIVGKPYAEKIRKEQKDRKITIYEVENETDQGDYWYTDIKDWEKYYRSRYISPKILTIKQYIAIFNETVSIINWLDQEEIGIEIVNTPYAQMQKALFWQFWNLAGKKIKKIRI